MALLAQVVPKQILIRGSPEKHLIAHFRHLHRCDWLGKYPVEWIAAGPGFVGSGGTRRKQALARLQRPCPDARVLACRKDEILRRIHS